ncbi:hypothetical protein Tco_1002909 [Tanacetum coccineum]|uniref:Uncharacterized protein n=1 Tax=Tanacetum coccineum TaxID=301880 RepID=A0ABQ5F7L6_9ASTR
MVRGELGDVLGGGIGYKPWGRLGYFSQGRSLSEEKDQFWSGGLWYGLPWNWLQPFWAFGVSLEDGQESVSSKSGYVLLLAVVMDIDKKDKNKAKLDKTEQSIGKSTRL